MSQTTVAGSFITLNTIDSDHYVDGSIDLAHIGANQIDGTKLALASQAAGDIMYYNGTDWIRLVKGTADQVLTMNDGATAPNWEAAAGTTINTNADNRVITGSGTANTLNGETTLLYGSSVLTLNASNVTTAQLIVHGYGDSGTDGPGRVSIRRSRTSTIGGDGALSSGGDYIGVIEFAGNDGNSVETSSSIRTHSTENWTDSAHGTKFRIFVTANGSTTQLAALIIDQDFDVTVKENNSTPSVTKGIAKAWMKNSGATTPLVEDSYNCTLTDSGAGYRTYTFGDDFENDDYVCVGNAYGPAGNYFQGCIFGQNTLAVGSVDCLVRTTQSAANVDVPNAVAFFGEAT